MQQKEGIVIRQHKIGIFDDEQAYMFGLMNYINSNTDSPLYAIAFSDAAKLEKYLEEKSIELLISPTDFDISSLHDEQLAGVKRIYLTDEKSPVAAPDSDVRYIFKYVRAGLIEEQAMDMLKTVPDKVRHSICHTYAVISPIGRCGKTRLSKGICFLDEVRGGLYIGMEAFGSMEYDAQHTDVLSDVFYMVKNRCTEFIEYVQGHIVQEGSIAYIPSVSSIHDMCQINSDDLFWMIEKLVEWGRYTTIVCDIDASVLQDLSCLEAFDDIYMPVLKDEISVHKKKIFYELLRAYELDKLAERIKEVELPDVDYAHSLMIRTIERSLLTEG